MATISARRPTRSTPGSGFATFQEAAWRLGFSSGAAAVNAALGHGPARKLVGIRLDGRAPARAHAAIIRRCGEHVGDVTSGVFSPT